LQEGPRRVALTKEGSSYVDVKDNKKRGQKAAWKKGNRGGGNTVVEKQFLVRVSSEKALRKS